jgi:hypothetical protein
MFSGCSKLASITGTAAFTNVTSASACSLVVQSLASIDIGTIHDPQFMKYDIFDLTKNTHIVDVPELANSL